MSELQIIQKLLPKVKEKLIIEPVYNWGRQWAPEKGRQPSGKVQFQHVADGVELKDEHLVHHFMAEVDFARKWDKRKKGEIDAIWGSLGLGLNFNGKVKVCGIDADSKALVKLIHNKVIPWFEERKIEYIEEYSGTESDPREHFWFFPQTNIPQLGLFLNQLKEDCDGSELWFNEQYPYGDRENNLFRLMWGWHVKNGKVNWGNLNGKDFEDIENGLQAIISCKVLDHDTLVSYVKPDEKKKKSYVISPSLEPIFTKDIDLGLPANLKDLLPSSGLLNNMARKCQAFHGMCANIDLINDTTGLGHNTGLYLSSVAQSHDQISKTEEGREAFKEICQAKRQNNWEEHNWDYYWGKQSSRVPYCKTWEETFNNCKGCPFQGQIISPKQLFFAKSLKIEKIKDITLKSLDWFRTVLFPQLKIKINKNIEYNQRKVYALKAPTGAGKSVWSDEYAVELAATGINVAIACNSFEVAMQHKTRIEQDFGGEAFILGSYDSIMEHFSGNIKCPSAGPIKEYRSLGVDAYVYKEKFCSVCPLYDKCNYPKQYKEVHEPKHRIIIIQHAHFACNEVVRQLFKKHFEVFFIDENFIDFLTVQLIPTKKELDLIEELKEEIPWLNKLYKWMKLGGTPGTEIRPSRNDLKPIVEAFNDEDVTYRLDQFIRLYNDEIELDEEVGVMKFNPIPEVPIVICTDATLEEKELKIIFNRDDIETIGDGIAVDPLLYHPDSRTYQILDGRTSKSELLKKEKLYEYLEKIGDEMTSDEYQNLTSLIVVFKEYEEINLKTGKKIVRDIEKECFDWLLRNYPSIIPRIAINHMAVGTNSFSDFNIVYLLAGPYMSNKQFKEAAFQLRFIHNCWRRLEGKPLLANDFPTKVSGWGKARLEKVQRDHRNGTMGYGDFAIYVPDEFYEDLVYKRLRGKKVQALGRIRDKVGKKTIRKIYDNDYFPNVVIDQVFTEAEYLKDIRDPVEE